MKKFTKYTSTLTLSFLLFQLPAYSLNSNEKVLFTSANKVVLEQKNYGEFIYYECPKETNQSIGNLENCYELGVLPGTSSKMIHKLNQTTLQSLQSKIKSDKEASQVYHPILNMNLDKDELVTMTFTALAVNLEGYRYLNKSTNVVKDLYEEIRELNNQKQEFISNNPDYAHSKEYQNQLNNEEYVKNELKKYEKRIIQLERSLRISDSLNSPHRSLATYQDYLNEMKMHLNKENQKLAQIKKSLKSTVKDGPKAFQDEAFDYRKEKKAPLSDIRSKLYQKAIDEYEVKITKVEQNKAVLKKMIKNIENEMKTNLIIPVDQNPSLMDERDYFRKNSQYQSANYDHIRNQLLSIKTDHNGLSKIRSIDIKSHQVVQSSLTKNPLRIKDLVKRSSIAGLIAGTASYLGYNYFFESNNKPEDSLKEQNQQNQNDQVIPSLDEKTYEMMVSSIQESLDRFQVDFDELTGQKRVTHQ